MIEEEENPNRSIRRTAMRIIQVRPIASNDATLTYPHDDKAIFLRSRKGNVLVVIQECKQLAQHL